MSSAEKQIFTKAGMQIRKPKTLLKKSADFLGANLLTRGIVRSISSFLIDTGTGAINFNLTSIDEIPGLWKPNSLLLIVSNHQSHADHLTILKVVQEVRKRVPELKTVYAPISITLENGIQSGISQTFYHKLALPTFEQNNISPTYVVTPNDRNIRGVIQTREEALAEAEKIRQIVKEENSGYFVLPEGTVKPGRHQKDRSINGMIEVNGPFFRIVVETARENNRQIICIPVGVNETYRLLSAEHIFLTRDSFKAIISRILRRKVMTLAEVNAGSPFIIGPEVNPRELNDSIMRDHVAPLVPKKAQGVYRKTPEFGNIW